MTIQGVFAQTFTYTSGLRGADQISVRVMPMVLKNWTADRIEAGQPVTYAFGHREQPFTAGFELEYEMIPSGDGETPQVPVPCQWWESWSVLKFQVKENSATIESPDAMNEILSAPVSRLMSFPYRQTYTYRLAIAQTFDMAKYGHSRIMGLFCAPPSRTRWLTAADMAEEVGLKDLSMALREIVAATSNLDWWENR